MYCSVCGKEESLPFTCKRCGLILCARHRLPENHACKGFNSAPVIWPIVKKTRPKRWMTSKEYEEVNRGPQMQRNKRRGVVYFTKEETLDLLKSWGVLTIAYCFSQYRNSIFSTPIILLYIYPWVALTSFLTFIIHELAHKISAQHYGLEAHYKANPFMLLASLAMSFSGFLFFIGGAVVIEGSYDKKENGVIALAGPLSNIAIATIVLIIDFFVYWSPISVFLESLFLINAFIAAYNMIPAWIFDGRKIFNWSKGVFAGMMNTAITLIVVYYLFFYVVFWY